MQLTSRRHSLATFLLCAAASGPAYAVTMPAFDLPEIGGIDMPGKAIAGDTVKITIKAGKDGTSVCGISVSFGDGASQQIKVNEDNAKLPLSVEHAYKKPGKYAVQVAGKKITTHHSCKGGASAGISVSAPKKSGKSARPKS